MERTVSEQARAALASEASGQRGDSTVPAPDTRPEPGSSARVAASRGRLIGHAVLAAVGLVALAISLRLHVHG